MRLLSTVLLLTSVLFQVSCGSSSSGGSPKSECTKLLKLRMDSTIKIAKKMPADVGKPMIADMKKNQDNAMKECMASTPGKRAKEIKKLKAVL